MARTILNTQNDRSIILIRFMLGAVFLSEGIQKFLFAQELGAGRFEKIGLPAPDFLGPFVGSIEILCGILLLSGLATRLAAITIIMSVAIIATKAEVLQKEGFWPMMHGSRTDWAMLLGGIFLAIKGGGAWSLDKMIYDNGPERRS
jgi:putative oxidoreductase